MGNIFIMGNIILLPLPFRIGDWVSFRMFLSPAHWRCNCRLNIYDRLSHTCLQQSAQVWRLSHNYKVTYFQLLIVTYHLWLDLKSSNHDDHDAWLASFNWWRHSCDWAFPAFPLFVRSAKPREASAPWRETRCLNGWPRNWRKNGWNWILGKQFSEIQMTIGWDVYLWSLIIFGFGLLIISLFWMIIY